MPLQDLNFDIISLILDLLYWEYNGSVDRASLAVASRISRLWRVPAQLRLFETIDIRSRRSLNAFARSTPTSSKRGRQLRASVLQLSIVISGHSSVLGITPSHSLLESDLVTLLPTLPNVYIVIATSMAPSISRAGQKALAALKTSRVRSLVVRYTGEPPDRRHQILFNFLTSLPLIERVMFIGKGTYLFPSSLPVGSSIPPSPQVNLKELRLDLRHSQPSIKGSDLAWLIGHAPANLSTLHLYDIVLDPTMTPFILSVAPQLQSFHVSSSRQFDLRDLPQWAECMIVLKELVIRNDIHSATDCYRVVTDLPRVMITLPPTMQHLGLAVNSQNALDTVRLQVEEWATRRGAALDVLTLVMTTTDSLDRWVPTKSVKRARLFHHTDKDVVFSFVRGVYQLPCIYSNRSQLSPLLPTERFPRYVETSFRGRITVGDEEEKRHRRFSPVGLIHQFINGR